MGSKSREVRSDIRPPETCTKQGIATQIDQGMELDSALVAAKLSPGKQRQAEVDCGGSEGVNGLFQSHPKGFVEIQSAGSGDQNLGQVGVDAPVAFLVGSGQRIASDRGTESAVIELVLNRTQTGLDVGADSPGRSVGQRPCTETDPDRRTDALVDSLGSDARQRLNSCVGSKSIS